MTSFMSGGREYSKRLAVVVFFVKKERFIVTSQGENRRYKGNKTSPLLKTPEKDFHSPQTKVTHPLLVFLTSISLCFLTTYKMTSHPSVIAEGWDRKNPDLYYQQVWISVLNFL